jgi:deferrochelatase/peroxidase EfeB
VVVPDAKRRQVPISERGPGWTYRPAADPGEHQPGISTAHLAHALLAAYDGDPREVVEEARQRPETVTIGFGPTAFSDRDRPLHLRPLPPFPGDNLRSELCGGDVCVLICSDDAPPEPLTSASPRWIQRGVRGDRGALGFREGTLNLRRPRDFEKYVWVTRNDRTSMIGGTYLVVRRIQVDPAWHALPESAQEQIIGRHKRSGAPLTGRRLYDAPILERLPEHAHINVAAKSPLLRRGFDTEDGLLFLAFMNDPRRQYVALQQRLAERDALHPFTTHIGSALFAIPPRRFLMQPPV